MYSKTFYITAASITATQSVPISATIVEHARAYRHVHFTKQKSNLPPVMLGETGNEEERA